VTDIGGAVASTGPAGVSIAEIVDAQDAARDLPGVPAVVGVADRPLHREADVGDVAVLRDLERLELVQQRLAGEPRRLLGAFHHVAALEGGDRDRTGVGYAEARGDAAELGLDLAEAVLVPVDEVHLVDAGDQVADAE
jgi:hypothetical protein